jgi:hypothetical protein
MQTPDYASRAALGPAQADPAADLEKHDYERCGREEQSGLLQLAP